MRALDAAAVGVVLTVAVQAPASFQALTGAVIGIRTHADGGGSIGDIRDAEVISAVVVGLVGVAGAVVLKSPIPIIAAVLADAVMVGIYEYALRTQHSLRTGAHSYDSDAAGNRYGPNGSGDAY